jgi:hypothetical protein
MAPGWPSSAGSPPPVRRAATLSERTALARSKSQAALEACTTTRGVVFGDRQTRVDCLLIGVTGSISSSYYLILLVPIVSAATQLGA